MRHARVRLTLVLMAALVPGARAGDAPAAPRPDLTKEPTLYVVGYAHLDTQWRWEYPQVVREYLPATLRDNFALFGRYPHYVFNFSGANRYRMLKEYYPQDFERVKAAVAAGRWFPAGSALEESDVNVPSAESLLRQVLYGSRFFRRELGKTSAEYMLPDCFGFPASLPSLLAHMGLKGFSTQKLSWGSAMGIPFNVGVWEGPDGRGVIAALNPGDYVGDVRQDLSRSPEASGPSGKRKPVDWPERVRRNGETGGLLTDYHYFGTGDIGGAPRESSVRLLEAIVTGGEAPLEDGGPPVRVGGGPLKVVSATAEQMFLDITPEQAARLPRYKGDLLLTNHSAGSITSQAYMKRWNRHNEVLADAAERASVAADWLGGIAYPRKRLTDAWTLVAGGQFHDILPGTATAKAFEYSWNDEVLALNQFAQVLTSASGAVAAALDTRARGTALVVFNPLAVAREDVVEAEVAFPSGTPAAVRVIGPDGKETPAQVAGVEKGRLRILFLARVPSVGYAVFDVQPASAPARSTLKVTPSSLENARYKVSIDAQGDVAGIFDKEVGKELLVAPLRLAFQTEKPRDWPAWNMDWADQVKPPRGYVSGPARVRVVENGPARVAVEIARESEGSRFVQTVRLAAGEAGGRVELANVVEWRSREAALKATFPLTAANRLATYNWDVGTVQRGTNDEKKFEVPSHQWLDLTDEGGTYGVTVLSGSKYGSDKPDDHTLRLTLVYTPGLGGGNGLDYDDQLTQDWGRHEFVYGLAGHAGDWRRARMDVQAYRLDQPLVAFESPAHAGPLGRSFSLLRVDDPGLRVLALKKAEDGDEVIVRVVETDGRPAAAARLAFAVPVTGGREVDGQERPLGGATVRDGALLADLGPYQLRTFAVTLAAPPARVAPPRVETLALPFDRSVATPDGRPALGAFDGKGRALPAEMLPRELAWGAVRFALAPATEGTPNAVVARGQAIAIPAGFTRAYVLAASADGDRAVTFRAGDTAVRATVQEWRGHVGQWDTRTFDVAEEPVPGKPDQTRTTWKYKGLVPGFIKRAPVAWFASHHHGPDGANEPWAYAYLFAHAIDLPAGARTLTLPDDPQVRVLAVTVAAGDPVVRPAHPLYDVLPPGEAPGR